MKWLCQLRLLSLSSFLAVEASVQRQLRATPSLLDVSRQRDVSNSWDYNDAGQGWTAPGCAASDVDFSQSPVNLSSTVAAKAPDNDNFFFTYPAYEAPVKMINDGRFLYTRLPTDDDKIGGISFGDSYPNHLTDEYFVYKMMFHSPSEHTYAGQRVPLELQLFHRKKDAKLTKDGEAEPADLAIVAIGFTESRDEASPFLRSLIDGGLPDQQGGTTMDNRGHPSSLDFAELFKPVFGAQGENAGFWDYTGSLTQPPCSGGVRWLIRQEAMNAKAKTLKLFRDSVRRSSGGNPANARALQIIGTRPVFPRFARNAVHMTVFSPDPPDAYSEALARVKQHQSDFKESLKNDASGSSNAISDGRSLEETVLASVDYRKCMKEASRVGEALSVAQAKKTNDCNLMDGSLETLQSITGGPARIEAARKHASLKKSCQDQTVVVSALEAQKATQIDQCDVIKSNVVKKFNAAKKAEEERKAKEAAAKAAAEATTAAPYGR